MSQYNPPWINLTHTNNKTVLQENTKTWKPLAFDEYLWGKKSSKKCHSYSRRKETSTHFLSELLLVCSFFLKPAMPVCHMHPSLAQIWSSRTKHTSGSHFSTCSFSYQDLIKGLFFHYCNEIVTHCKWPCLLTNSKEPGSDCTLWLPIQWKQTPSFFNITKSNQMCLRLIFTSPFPVESHWGDGMSFSFQWHAFSSEKYAALSQDQDGPVLSNLMQWMAKALAKGTGSPPMTGSAGCNSSSRLQKNADLKVSTKAHRWPLFQINNCATWVHQLTVLVKRVWRLLGLARPAWGGVYTQLTQHEALYKVNN